MKSMTGYGRGSFADEKIAVSVELKTVNNRFLDVHLRLPSELSSAETALKRQIGARLSRGRVDVNISFERTSEVVYEINRPLVAGYLSALRQMQQDFDLSGEPDLNVIARLPGVMQTAKENVDDSSTAALEKAIGTALNELEAMREAEGEALKTELLSRLDEIERQTAIIEPNTASVTENYRARLTKKINDLMAKTDAQIELDQARLAQEVAYLAERSDISEELARLKSHLTQFRETCASDADTGKRLDFLTQELNREANTILSKSIDLVIKEAALAIKAEIEKLREQVQNVE
ncbi:MAG TPA: YicC/YloC family endoribonuclease [Pyrinomonadaceae bacterium]|nr:YicC/YloC family endoribonuclease [Pyrinomonadaceae bacterium]